MVYIHSQIRLLHIFPESIWAIFIGISLGTIIKFSHSAGAGLAKSLEFEPHAFFLFLLPPIMFQAGFSMSASTFFRNIITINAFAIGATIVSAFVFGFMFFYGMMDSDTPIPFIDSLHFGCFISAIDPVATISIFQSMHVSDNIYMIVFGESTLNDAVAIALASSSEGIRDAMEHGLAPNYLSVVVNSIVFFMVFFFGSLLIGCIMSLLTSFLFIKLELEALSWLEIGLFLQ